MTRIIFTQSEFDQLSSDRYALKLINYLHFYKPGKDCCRSELLAALNLKSEKTLRPTMRLLKKLGYLGSKYLRNKLGKIVGELLSYRRQPNESTGAVNIYRDGKKVTHNITTTTSINNNNNRADQKLIVNQEDSSMIKKYQKEEILWIEYKDIYKQIQAMAGVTAGEEYKLQEFNNFKAHQVEHFDEPIDEIELQAKFMKWSARTRANAYQFDEFAKREVKEAEQEAIEATRQAELVNVNNLQRDEHIVAIAEQNGISANPMEVGRLFGLFKHYNIVKSYTSKTLTQWHSAFAIWLPREMNFQKPKQNNNYTTNPTNFKPEQKAGYNAQQKSGGYKSEREKRTEIIQNSMKPSNFRENTDNMYNDLWSNTELTIEQPDKINYKEEAINFGKLKQEAELRNG